MKRREILSLTVFAAVCLLAAGARGETLLEELNQLDRMRKGRATDFAAVEDAGRVLLKSYPEPAEQGQIYYQLAHIYAQTGIDKTQYKVLEHAATAMSYPLSDDHRLRLYIFSGDAASLTKKPFISRRRDAALHYLLGLENIATRKLATEAPDPGPQPSRIDPDEDENAAEQKARAEAQAKWNAAWEAQKQAKLVADYKTILARQITELYRRKPAADKELDELTLKYLGDCLLRNEMLATVQKPAP